MYPDLEDFFHIMSQELEEQNRTEQFGCYWTDEELASHLQKNFWNEPGEWLAEYRDENGERNENKKMELRELQFR